MASSAITPQRLSNAQRRCLERIATSRRGSDLGVASAHPDHWDRHATTPLKRLLAAGLITYHDDSSYLYHSYRMTPSGRTALSPSLSP